MENVRFTRDDARAYLSENTALRQAVGAASAVSLEPHYLGAGEHNLNFWFQEPASGSKYVLRVNVATQPFHSNQVLYEFSTLQALAPSGCTPLPVYLDDSPHAPEKGALVETFCPGVQLDFDHLQPGQLECAAQLMADIHAVPVDESNPLFRPHDPLRGLFDECLERFKLYRASAQEDAHITAWVERFIRRIIPALESVPLQPADCNHIVNTETLASHFLISEEGTRDAARAKDGARAEGRQNPPSPGNPLGSGRFCASPGAFVDWERPIIGEVAQDVAYFVSPTTTFWDSEWLCPADTAEQMVADYWRAVDGRFSRGSFDRRFPLYFAVTALRSTTWCCRALVYQQRKDLPKTAKAARKVPIYLSDDFLARIYKDCFDLLP